MVAEWREGALDFVIPSQQPRTCSTRHRTQLALRRQFGRTAEVCAEKYHRVKASCCSKNLTNYYGHNNLSWSPSEPASSDVMLNSSYQPSYQPFDTYQYQPQPILQLPKPSIESAPVVSSQLSAFRLGGPVDLFSRNYIGYLLNWVLIGFFNGAITALVYSLFGVYLHLQAYRGNAAVALLEFAWNFKFIFSFLTDGAPINRYRRKPYMFIGWGILTVLLLVFAFRPQMEPYKRYGVIVNRDAESKGPHYVIPLIITSLARIMVITACEGMMFEVAHREWELERGRTQSISMMARGVGQVLGIILVAFGSFGPDFGGTYTHSLSLRAMFSIWTLVALTGMVVTKFLLSEEPIASSAQPFASQMHRIWRIVQHRTTWQIMLFGLFQNAVMTLKYHEKDAFYRIRLGATPLSLNMSDAVGTVGSVAAACLLIQFWLNTNWRKLMLWSLMAGIFARSRSMTSYRVRWYSRSRTFWWVSLTH